MSMFWRVGDLLSGFEGLKDCVHISKCVSESLLWTGQLEEKLKVGALSAFQRSELKEKAWCPVSTCMVLSRILSGCLIRAACLLDSIASLGSRLVDLVFPSVTVRERGSCSHCGNIRL